MLRCGSLTRPLPKRLASVKLAEVVQVTLRPVPRVALLLGLLPAMAQAEPRILPVMLLVQRRARPTQLLARRPTQLVLLVML